MSNTACHTAEHVTIHVLLKLLNHLNVTWVWGGGRRAARCHDCKDDKVIYFYLVVIESRIPTCKGSSVVTAE